MSGVTKFSGNDPQRAGARAPLGSLPFAPSHYGYANGNAATAEIAAKMGTINEHLVFNPAGNGTKAREYRKYLESHSRARQHMNRQEQMIASQKDVKWDYSKGLFGVPHSVQPAARGAQHKVVVEDSPLVSGLHGAVGASVDKIGSGYSLQVLDPATNSYRFTNGDNHNLVHEDCALDSAVKRARASGALAFQRSMHNQYRPRQMRAGDGNLAAHTRDLMARLARPSRIASGATVLPTVDGYNAAAQFPPNRVRQAEEVEAIAQAGDLDELVEQQQQAQPAAKEKTQSPSMLIPSLLLLAAAGAGVALLLNNSSSGNKKAEDPFQLV